MWPFDGKAVLAKTLSALHARCFMDGESWSATQICGSLDLETTRLWLADRGAQPCGFLLAQDDGLSLEILTFCVDPAARRRGIGAALLEKALSDLPERGAFLEVAADNAAARKLYEKAGFERIGTRKNYYLRAQGAQDALCYRLEPGRLLLAASHDTKRD